MTTYSKRVDALLLIAEHLENDEGIKQSKELRLHSDAIEIIGHPRNPKFYPEKLAENDLSKIKYEEFRAKFRAVQLNLLNIIANTYDEKHAQDLGYMVTKGETNRVHDYLKNTMKDNSPCSSI